jgi:UDP-2,3-diacylglucosamine hydrolase
VDGLFPKELNIPVFHDNQEYTFGEKTFLIGHGDGKVLEI